MREMLGRRDRKSNVIVPWISDKGVYEKEGEVKDKRVIKLGLVFRYVVTYIWFVGTISICPQSDT